MDPAAIGAQVRTLRQSRTWTQRALARRIPCSHVHLHNVERGRSRPSAELLERLDHVLEAGGELTRMAAEPAPATVPAAAVDASGIAATPDTVAWLRDSLNATRVASHALPPGSMIGVLEHTVELIRHLRAQTTGQLRRDMIGLAADHAYVISGLYTEADDPDGADRWTARAIEWAGQAGWWPLVALAHTSRASWAWWRGDPDTALDAAAAAAHTPGALLTNRSGAEHYRARALSQLGDEAGALHALDEAAALDEASVDEPLPYYLASRGSGYYSPADHEVLRAVCLTALGPNRARQAVEMLEHGLAAVPSMSAGRRRITTGLRLALAAEAAGELDAAADAAAQVVTPATLSGSARALGQVRALHQRLTQRAPEIAAPLGGLLANSA